MKQSSRSRAVALLVVAFALALTPALVASQPQDQGKVAPAAVISFTGEFDSNGVRLTLEHTGDAVTGTLLLGDLPCAVKGTVKDGVLSAQVTIENEVEQITAKFENDKLLVSDKNATLTFERVKTDQPTRVAHPGGLDFILPVGWSKREMQGKLQFMPPKGTFKGNAALIAEVQEWAYEKPITDSVGLGMFRAGFKESLPTFDDIEDPKVIALGNDSGVMLRLKGNTDEVAKVRVNVYLRSIGKKMAILMLIGDAEDVDAADQTCRALLTDVVTPGAQPAAAGSLVLTCPDGWTQQTAKTGITLRPQAKEGDVLPEDFVAVAEQPWSENRPFFEAMTTDRVDEEVRIAFANAKRVGDLERLGESEADGVRCLYNAMITPEDTRMLDVRLKKLGEKMVIQIWLGTKTRQQLRQPTVAAIFKSVSLAPDAKSAPEKAAESK